MKIRGRSNPGFPSDIGEILRSVRLNKGLSPAQVHENGGPDPDTVRKIEAGIETVREGSILSFLKGLDSSLADALDDAARNRPLETNVARYITTLLDNQRESAAFRFFPTPDIFEQLHQISGDDREQAAIIESSRALAFRSTGDFNEAKSCNRNASVIYESLENVEMLVESLLNELANMRPIESSHAIRAMLTRLIYLFNTNPNLPQCLLARFENEVGTICFDHGEFEISSKFCQNAHTRFERYCENHGDAFGMRSIALHRCFNQRRIAHLIGISDLDEGVEGLQNTSDEFSKLHATEGEGNTLFSGLVLHIQHGEYETGNSFLIENRKHILKGSKWTQAALAAIQGYILYRLGDKAQAKSVCEEALQSIRNFEFYPPKLTTPEGESPFRIDCILGLGSPVVRKFGRIRERREKPFSLEELNPMLERF